MMNVAQSLLDVLPKVAQELIGISVFFFSLVLFNQIGQRQLAHRREQKKLAAAKPGKPSVSLRKVAAEPSASALHAKQGQAAQGVEAQMLQLLSQHEFTRALNLYRSFERNGQERQFSEEVFSSYIQSAIRVGKMDVVERLLSSMLRRKSEPSHEFWRTLFRMLSSRKHFNACVTIYNIYSHVLPADKVVFSCLINGALENGASERASAMLDRYCEADLEPRDFVLVFRTYVATNDLKSAEKTFEALGEDMTSLMLNLLLLICVNNKQPERALQHLHKAQALQDRRCNQTDTELPDSDSIVDVVSYNTVIKGFSQAGMLPQCFDCLHEMRSHNLEPDDATFGMLLDMFITDNEGVASKVVDLLGCGEQLVDTAMCALFIKGLIRAQRLPKAIELYEEMKRRDLSRAKPDLLTYSLLIRAHIDAHDLERALLIVEDMTAAGHRPDDIILSNLIEGCRYVGNHALGKRLFADMLSAGVKPSDFTLTSMVKLHGRCGAHEEALQLVRDWEKQHGTTPSVIHYTCLMSGCLRSKNYEQAWQAYQAMLEMDIRPDETTMATMLPGMVAAQQWDHVIAIATKALQHSPAIPLHAEALKNALTQMRAASGQGLQVKKLQAIVKQASLHIPPCHPRQPTRPSER